MKPALSPQTTGFLPSRSTSASTSSSTSGSVTTVRTISTRFCTGAGLKKWTPMTRPGWALAVEISVTESDEVLVARIAVGRDDAVELAEDRLLDLERLHDGLDHEVGVGEVLHRGGERDPAEQLGLLRPRSSCRASPRGPVECSRCWRPRATRLVVELDADDGEAVAGEHLGDAGTHGAEADDADGAERRALDCWSCRASCHARSSRGSGCLDTASRPGSAGRFPPREDSSLRAARSTTPDG